MHGLRKQAGAILLTLLSLFTHGCSKPAPPLNAIAFGSCSNQEKPQPIWDDIAFRHPDLFIHLGDNIYADTTDESVMQEKYNRFGSLPGYQRLRDICPVIATWDDHDYGANDAGREFPMKRASENMFLDFFDVPETSQQRQHPGVYGAYLYGPVGKRVQVLLLDTRYFRSPLKIMPGVKGNYLPIDTPDTTMLGEEQWEWLERELRRPAEVRILASSIQVLPNDHTWEKWGTMPAERSRLLELLAETRANGVIILSGDRHHGELSATTEWPGNYTLYEITSSSLNRKRPRTPEPNRYRLGKIVYDHNFGFIRFNWDHEEGPKISLYLYLEGGRQAVVTSLPLQALR
jgi:alkaline phosphatase D